MNETRTRSKENKDKHKERTGRKHRRKQLI